MATSNRTIAICYDFDGTLAQGNIQENAFIPALNMKKESFWEEVNTLSKENQMDSILAYMYVIITKSREKNVKINKESIIQYGKKVSYFPGVEDYFKRINKYAKTKNIQLEHYIISSGTKEMIEGTSIANEFKFIYACSFKYDHHNVPVWPAISINYTTKTQFLFRINKGIDNSWDHKEINKYMPQNERPIPFENMIFVGDGETDIPAMKTVKEQRGTSIAVYPADDSTKKQEAQNLLKDERVSYVAEADYQDSTTFDLLIKETINRIASAENIKPYSLISETSQDLQTPQLKEDLTFQIVSTHDLLEKGFCIVFRDWNDFGYYTSCSLYQDKKIIAWMKLAHRDLKPNDHHIKDFFKNKKQITLLDENFFSTIKFKKNVNTDLNTSLENQIKKNFRCIPLDAIPENITLLDVVQKSFLR